MRIELRTIDETNRDNVLSLEVSDSQKQYIASNKKSLEAAAEEKYKDIARPFAIYADNTLVGFAMFAFDLDYEDAEDRYWLWRFMIDRRSQGKGYGAAALEESIEYFRKHGAGYIKLSTKGDNAAAVSLYRKYAFEENGERNGEEIVFRLTL